MLIRVYFSLLQIKRMRNLLSLAAPLVSARPLRLLNLELPMALVAPSLLLMLLQASPAPSLISKLLLRRCFRLMLAGVLTLRTQQLPTPPPPLSSQPSAES